MNDKMTKRIKDPPLQCTLAEVSDNRRSTGMEIKSLIDPEGGLVNRRIFADREIYELEREHLFARCWLYLGHESEVPHPGDFVTTYMGEEPIILCRDLTGRLRAFLNL